MLYVVVNITGGYAREDPPSASVIGAYYDVEVANKVARVVGSCSVMPVDVNKISAGYASTAKILGVEFPEYVKIIHGK